MPNGASTATAKTSVHKPPSQPSSARHNKIGAVSACGTAITEPPDVVRADTASK